MNMRKSHEEKERQGKRRACIRALPTDRSAESRVGLAKKKVKLFQLKRNVPL